MSTAPLDFTAGFAGVKPLGSYVQMPEMPCKGKVTSIEVNDHKSEPGARVAKITVSITESGYEGATRTMNQRLPDATEKGQNARRGWRTLLEAVGYTAAQLDGQQAIRVTNDTILNREGTFYHKPGQQGVTGSYDEIDAILPSVYAERKRARAAGGGAPVSNVVGGGATIGGNTPQPATLGGGGNGATVASPLSAQDLKASLLS